MNLDSALIGVVVGSVLALLGTVGTQLLAIFKEERMWKRQAEAEDLRHERDADAQRLQHLRDSYRECIGVLSTFISLNDDSPLEAREAITQEVHKCLAMVLLAQDRGSGSGDVGRLAALQEDLAQSADKRKASNVREQVVRMAVSDPRLFTPVVSRDTQPDGRWFRVEIDDDFRRTEFVAGRELRDPYTVGYRLEDLTPYQRELLWSIYMPSHHCVPDRLGSLPMPDGSAWRARVNPESSSTKQMLAAWEADHRSAQATSVPAS